MLVQPNSTQLGDKALNPEEAVLKLREENLSLAAKYKIAGQDELADPLRSSGNVLPYQELIRRLEKINSSILFKDGSAGSIAVYIPKNRAEIAEDGYDLALPAWHNEHKYITGFPKDQLPEFSHLTLDERGLPKREVRGWRTVLIALIKSGGITYQDAVRHFGDAEGSRSGRWHEQLRNFK